MAKPPAPAAASRATPQGELFQLDSPLTGEVRGERSLMAFPFFALSKNAWMKPLAYATPSVSIEVRPSARGVATIYDKEIVLYIASLMVSKIEKGETVLQDFTFTAHDLFSVTGSNHSARSYGRLADALERLQGTQIRTNIEAGGEGEEGYFSWLSEARLQYARSGKGEKRLKAVRVRLCDWLFRSILRDRQVLDYAHTYFQLGPIERRIYEVARSTCVEGEELEIDLATFRLQIGFQNPLSNFRIAMRQIAAAASIPDYHIRLIEEEPEEDGTGPRRAGRKAGRAKVIISRRLEEVAEEPAEEPEEDRAAGIDPAPALAPADPEA